MKKQGKVLKILSAAALSSVFAFSAFASGAHAATGNTASTAPTQPKTAVIASGATTATPIKHVVVIFQENVSFDHYFGTYPYALNIKGEPQFTAKSGTPQVNNLLTPTDYNGTQPGIAKVNLVTQNPNTSNPVRIDHSEPITDDMDHGYADEIAGTDGGKMDLAVQKTTGTSWPIPNGPANMVMNYYDGNTVTGIWNYAQNFAINDNSFGTTYGPSTPGAINLVAGDTTGATAYNGNSTTTNSPGTSKAINAVGTDIGDQDPFYDSASNPKSPTIAFSSSNKNVGDLLNAKGITWGWFEGGFANPTAQSTNVGGGKQTDYIPHHEPFQYYKSTANPTHAAPSSVNMIGKSDVANHQYDLTNFWQAVNTGNMPAVSYLKAAGYQDGHAGYSDPLDEQKFLVDTINKLEKTPDWSSTAVVISYDDSDGWYDHVFGPSNGKSEASGQMGNGPRLPLMVISPYAKQNYVDHTLTNQSSILKFVEDNWNLGRIGGNSLDASAGSMMNMFDFSENAKRAPKVFLDDQTGEVINTVPVTTQSQSFSDVNKYATQINFLKDRGVVNGYSNGTFKPNQAVTRLEAVEMVLKQMNINPASRLATDSSIKDPGFKDLKPGDAGYAAAAVAYNLGIIKGEPNGNFDPNGKLSRASMATILVRAYNLKGSTTASFTDVKSGFWASTDINTLAADGITHGYPDKTFRPNQSITRGEFSVLLYNYLNGQATN